MTAKTYTKRENAKRAAIAAGVPAELVQITFHRSSDEVRFGWKQKAVQERGVADADNNGAGAKLLPAQPVVTTSKPRSEAAPTVEREERNGVRRPRAGGVCAAVWAWLDAHPGATIKDAKAAAPENRWNENNVACEFYAWRKFNGLARATLANG